MKFTQEQLWEGDAWRWKLSRLIMWLSDLPREMTIEQRDIANKKVCEFFGAPEADYVSDETAAASLIPPGWTRNDVEISPGMFHVTLTKRSTHSNKMRVMGPWNDPLSLPIAICVTTAYTHDPLIDAWLDEVWLNSQGQDDRIPCG